MAEIYFKPMDWVAAVDVPEEALGAIKAEMKTIKDKEGVSLLAEAAKDALGARTRLAKLLKKHGVTPAWEKAAPTKATVKKAERKTTASASKEAAPAAKKAAGKKPAAKRTAAEAPASKSAPPSKKAAAKAPAAGTPAEKPAPVSKKTAAKATAGTAPKAKRAEAKTPEAKLVKKSKAALTDATARLRAELQTLRVECPVLRRNAVRDATAALVAAKTMAAFSPNVAMARAALKEALEGVVGYKEAKKAIAEAEKSPQVTEAKATLQRARASARGPGVQEVLDQIANSPEIKAAEAALAAAKKPAEVVAAVEALGKARSICADRMAGIKNKFAPQLAKLQQALAEAKGALPTNAPAMTTTDVLASIQGSGPPTTVSAGSSRRNA